MQKVKLQKIPFACFAIIMHFHHITSSIKHHKNQWKSIKKIVQKEKI